MRIALVHDWLTGMRGGERVLEQLVEEFPQADLYTLIHLPGSVTPTIEARPIRVSPLSRLPGVARYYRALLPLFPWAIRRFDLSAYDLVISCSHAVAKGVRTGPNTVHLCYCLTPMRYIWDQADAYLGRGPKRWLATPLLAALRAFDRATSDARAVSGFVAVSAAVRDRIARHYGRDASVVYPPAEPVTRGTPSARTSTARGDYLMVASFVPYKREDVAIDAFRGLDRHLVVAGDGPLRNQLARNAPDNVEFVGRVSDAALHELYANCRALLYPQEEDFGIIAVEAQWAGRPVIAFAAGGALETVRVDGQAPTGIHFGPQTPRALRAAIRRFEANEASFDPAHIRSWAGRFANQRFREALRHEVEKLLELCPDPPQ